MTKDSGSWEVGNNAPVYYFTALLLYCQGAETPRVEETKLDVKEGQGSKNS